MVACGAAASDGCWKWRAVPVVGIVVTVRASRWRAVPMVVGIVVGAGGWWGQRPAPAHHHSALPGA